MTSATPRRRARTLAQLGPLVCVWAVLPGAAAAAGESVDFAGDVQPILQQHCAECHGADEQNDCTENPVQVHDLHATVLHQMGMDHERLTFRHAGRDFRLTDVHGTILHDIIS